eukprot:7824891-Pyramimonas_sp.AAC.1
MPLHVCPNCLLTTKSLLSALCIQNWLLMSPHYGNRSAARVVTPFFHPLHIFEIVPLPVYAFSGGRYAAHIVTSYAL